MRIALENPRWCYTRIQGALCNLGQEVGRGTIANVLKREGIAPAPQRGKRTPWSAFLKAHWRTIVAADFFTAEVWTLKGLITHYVLFIIELAKRIVHILGITTHPDEAWMLQVGRNVTDTLDGALIGKSHLIVDRDTKYQVPQAVPTPDRRVWDGCDQTPAHSTRFEGLCFILHVIGQVSEYCGGPPWRGAGRSL